MNGLGGAGHYSASINKSQRLIGGFIEAPLRAAEQTAQMDSITAIIRFAKRPARKPSSFVYPSGGQSRLICDFYNFSETSPNAEAAKATGSQRACPTTNIVIFS